MIKALIFDLDGTIVSPNTGTYSPKIAEAFDALREKGILLIAATGRSPYEFKVTKMIDNLRFDAIVCLNGQYCYTEKEDLFLNPFPAQQAEELLSSIRQSGFPCLVICKQDAFINKVTPQVEIAQAAVHMSVPEVRALDQFYGKEILMLTVFVEEQNEAAFLENAKSVSATRWNPHAIDLVPQGSGKCRGIEVVLNHFGLGWENVFAFGDGNNDYEMLGRAKKGFAMKNSSPRLLTGEFEIIDDVDHDGVVKALRQYGIL